MRKCPVLAEAANAFMREVKARGLDMFKPQVYAILDLVESRPATVHHSHSRLFFVFESVVLRVLPRMPGELGEEVGLHRPFARSAQGLSEFVARIGEFTDHVQGLEMFYTIDDQPAAVMRRDQLSRVSSVLTKLVASAIAFRRELGSPQDSRQQSLVGGLTELALTTALYPASSWLTEVLLPLKSADPEAPWGHHDRKS